MTPKDKADYILSQFCKWSKADDITKPIQSAKQCAVFFIDEVITAMDQFGYGNTMYDNFETGRITMSDDEDPATYWKRVKQEIEKYEV